MEYSKNDQLEEEEGTLRLTFDGVLLPLPGLPVLEEAPVTSSSASRPEGNLCGVVTWDEETLGGLVFGGCDASVIVLAGEEVDVLLG